MGACNQKSTIGISPNNNSKENAQDPNNPHTSSRSNTTSLNTASGGIKSQSSGPKFMDFPSSFEVTGKIDYNSSETFFDLRLMLSDPIGQHALSDFARKNMTRELLFCWVDISEYHHIPTNEYRRCKANSIFRKYLRESGGMKIGGVKPEEIDKIAELLRLAKEEPLTYPVAKDLFDEIESICYQELLQSTYLPFRKTPEYLQYKTIHKRSYNTVRVGDFEYMGALGQGGFGRVVHCKKKSTNQHTAMKIQLKSALLRHFRSDIAALQSEQLVFKSCHHPFIVNMNYSFQTDLYVFIVLDLVTGGDLHSARKATPLRRLSEERMIFYAAEIVLAVDHLHEMGIIYRDLKPQNVLLRADGHVQLTDMGLAAPLDMAWAWDDDGTLGDTGEDTFQMVPENSILFDSSGGDTTTQSQGVKNATADRYLDPKMLALSVPAKPAGSTDNIEMKIGGTNQPISAMDFMHGIERGIIKYERTISEGGPLTPKAGVVRTGVTYEDVNPALIALNTDSPRNNNGFSPNASGLASGGGGFSPKNGSVSPYPRNTSPYFSANGDGKGGRGSSFSAQDSQNNVDRMSELKAVNNLEDQYVNHKRAMEMRKQNADKNKHSGSTTSEADSIEKFKNRKASSSFAYSDNAAVEAPLVTSSLDPDSTTKPSNELRKKSKVARSAKEAAEMNAAGFSRPRNSSRSMSKKDSSVGMKRDNLTRGESLLHETLKTTEAMPYIPERRKSIVGTRGYMAPEMVELRLKSYDNVEGYTEGVDWFALGVTMFELMTGRRPFDRKRGAAPPPKIAELDSLYAKMSIIEGMSEYDAKRLKRDIEEYETLMEPLQYPSFISPTARDFMEGLMNRKLDQRIGCMKDGLLSIKSHEFFSSIQWDALLDLRIQPPFIPEPMEIREKPAFNAFEDMMHHFESDKNKPPKYDWNELPSDKDDAEKRFMNWDWISPLTLKKEMGIEQEMAIFEAVEGNLQDKNDSNRGVGRKPSNIQTSMNMLKKSNSFQRLTRGNSFKKESFILKDVASPDGVKE